MTKKSSYFSQIPSTLLNFTTYGYILCVKSIDLFKNLQTLKCKSISCSLVKLVNLKSLDIDDYSKELPPNLIEYKSCKLDSSQYSLPQSLERLFIKDIIWLIDEEEYNILDFQIKEKYENLKKEDIFEVPKYAEKVNLPKNIKICEIDGDVNFPD